jgi:hypothetical protein
MNHKYLLLLASLSLPAHSAEINSRAMEVLRRWMMSIHC